MTTLRDALAPTEQNCSCNRFDNLTVFFNAFLSLLVKQAGHCIAWIFNRFFECLGSNHGIPVVSFFSVFNYYRRITSPFLKWLGDQTLFVASIVDKQGASCAKSSIKMRTILQPGAILEILIAKRAQAAIFIRSWELVVRWR